MNLINDKLLPLINPRQLREFHDPAPHRSLISNAKSSRSIELAIIARDALSHRKIRNSLNSPRSARPYSCERARDCPVQLVFLFPVPPSIPPTSGISEFHPTMSGARVHPPPASALSLSTHVEKAKLRKIVSLNIKFPLNKNKRRRRARVINFPTCFFHQRYRSTRNLQYYNDSPRPRNRPQRKYQRKRVGVREREPRGELSGEVGRRRVAACGVGADSE